MVKKRICTNRDFERNSYEAIAIDDNGYFWWEGDDNGGLTELWQPVEPTTFGFLVDLDFVKEFFAKCKRQLDISKLPSNYKANPYQQWLANDKS
jgi:hypothetical protein